MIDLEERKVPKNSAIVVAHPDDEGLWFSSLMREVDKIVICLLGSKKHPELGPARKASLRRYPLPNVVSLAIDQADVFGGADWNKPILTEYGIALSRKPAAAPKYQANYQALLRSLRQELAGCAHVFTHNPWGEYGHEEHVQLHRVVKELGRELPFQVWYPNYCSEKSYPLMLQQGMGSPIDSLTLKTDAELAGAIKEIYQANKCWTWYPDWIGFKAESFIAEQNETAPPDAFAVLPLNFIRVYPQVEKTGFLKKLFS